MQTSFGQGEDLTLGLTVTGKALILDWLHFFYINVLPTSTFGHPNLSDGLQ